MITDWTKEERLDKKTRHEKLIEQRKISPPITSLLNGEVLFEKPVLNVEENQEIPKTDVMYGSPYRIYKTTVYGRLHPTRTLIVNNADVMYVGGTYDTGKDDSPERDLCINSTLPLGLRKYEKKFYGHDFVNKGLCTNDMLLCMSVAHVPKTYKDQEFDVLNMRGFNGRLIKAFGISKKSYLITFEERVRRMFEQAIRLKEDVLVIDDLFPELNTFDDDWQEKTVQTFLNVCDEFRLYFKEVYICVSNCDIFKQFQRLQMAG